MLFQLALNWISETWIRQFPSAVFQSYYVKYGPVIKAVCYIFHNESITGV